MGFQFSSSGELNPGPCLQTEHPCPDLIGLFLGSGTCVNTVATVCHDLITSVSKPRKPMISFFLSFALHLSNNGLTCVSKTRYFRTAIKAVPSHVESKASSDARRLPALRCSSINILVHSLQSWTRWAPLNVFLDLHQHDQRCGKTQKGYTTRVTKLYDISSALVGAI